MTLPAFLSRISLQNLSPRNLSPRKLLLLSTVLLGFGLFAPCMTILPRFGEFTTTIKIFQPDFDRPQTISIFGGVLALLSDGKYFVAAIILIFSVIFPLWKLGVIWHSLNSLEAGGQLDSQLHIIEKLGKFSMVDIFVIALLVLAIKGLPGGSAVTLHWGVVAFAASALIGMALPALLEERAAANHR